MTPRKMASLTGVILLVAMGIVLLRGEKQLSANSAFHLTAQIPLNREENKNRKTTENEKPKNIPEPIQKPTQPKPPLASILKTPLPPPPPIPQLPPPSPIILEPAESAPEPASPSYESPPLSQPKSVLPSAPQPQPTPEPQPAPPLPPPAQIAHRVVISEIQLTGGTGSTQNDFIELYNPNDTDIDISGWKLRKRTGNGNESSIRSFPSGSIIPTHGYFLWANSKDDFADSISADVSSTASIAVNNSIALINSDGAIEDQVAWGSDLVNPFQEGTPLIQTLDANQSYERKPDCNLYCDTGDNAHDFTIRSQSNPQ
jgi:hypothetical protein